MESSLTALNESTTDDVRLRDDGLGEFCLEHRERLVGLLALYTGDVRLGEQLAQDALVRLCDHWPRVRTMSKPERWLTRVAINGANSWFRSRAAERRASVRHGPVEPHYSPPDVADAVAIRTSVSALPRRQRQALVLRYYAGLSVAEAAEQMQCAQGTVKALTFKAIRALRRDLGMDLEEPDDGY